MFDQMLLAALEACGKRAGKSATAGKRATGGTRAGLDIVCKQAQRADRHLHHHLVVPRQSLIDANAAVL